MNHLLKRGDRIHDRTDKTRDLVVLDPQLIEGRIQVLSLQENTAKFQDYNNIRAGIEAGKFSLERKGALTTKSHLKRTAAEDSAEAETLNVMNMIYDLMHRKGLSLLGAYEHIKKEQFDLSLAPEDRIKVPSRASIYRHDSRVRNGLTIRIGNATKGNYQPRYTEAVYEHIVETADTYYLQPGSRWRFRTFTDLVNETAREKNLINQAQKISRDYAKRVILDISASDPERYRLDPKDVASARSIAKHRISIGQPLMRVEQDAVHIPWKLRTPFGDSTNVWLVHVIDCCTGMVLGWAFVIGSPTVSQTLKCLERALYRKSDLFKSLAIDSSVDPYGTPALVIFDNGPENKGSRIEALTRLGMKIMYCKSRHGHGKPFIERLNLSLKSALETLPGCTRVDGKDGQRDPDTFGDADMTIEEFERWVVRWYYERWAHQPLKRLKRSIFVEDALGKTPAARWNHFEKDQQYAMPLSPQRELWRLIQYEKVRCTVSAKTGITVDTFNFRGAALKTLIEHNGETVVDVLVDPDDFRSVFVPVGEDLGMLELINDIVDTQTPGYTFVQAKELLKERESEVKEAPQAIQFQKDLLKRSTLQSKEVKPPKPGSRAASKQTSDNAKKHDAIKRAALNPFSATVDGGDRLAVGAHANQPGAQTTDSKATEPFDDIQIPELVRRDSKTGEQR